MYAPTTSKQAEEAPSELPWLETRQVIKLHDRLIARLGGLPGTRDAGLLESALMRPRVRYHYGRISTPEEVAAAYASAITRNHPFLDGNKRTSLMVVRSFLHLCGVDFRPDNDEAVEKLVGLSEGTLSEEDFASWVSASVRTMDIEPALATLTNR